MNSSKKRLLIMLAAVLAAVGLLLLLNLDCASCGDDGAEETEHYHEEETDEEDGGPVLISRNSDELESLVIKNPKGTYHIRRASTGLLEIEELSGLPVENDFIEIAWFASLSVNYSAKITPDDDLASLASFGLEKPQTVISYRFTDGTAASLLIGDLLADEEGRYYFRFVGNDGAEGDGSVYITDFNLAFFQGDTYWLSDDFFGDSHISPEISDIDMSGTSLPCPLKVYSNPAMEKWQRWYGYRYIINENGTEYPADDYLCKSFVEELESMVADEAVCAHPTAEQKTAYGLDDPGLIIKHKRSGAEKTIRISKADYSKSYAMVDGIDVVYELVNDTYPLITSMTVDTLRSPNVLTLYFETVSRFTVSSSEGVHSFELSRSPMSGTGLELYEYSVKSGEGGATLNSYKALLEVFNSAQATEFSAEDGAGDSEPVLTVNIEFFDQRRPAEVIRCYPAGNRRYRYTINGRGNGIVTQMWLDRLISQAQTADSGAITD